MTDVHDRARELEEHVARLVGGHLQPGSGSGMTAKLDVASGTILWECKDTAAESFRVTAGLLDTVRAASTGSGVADGSIVPVLAVRVGAERRTYAVVDLDVLVGWLREPPALLPATPRERLRETARTPRLLR